MSNNKVIYLYIGAAICTVLILLLIIQVYTRDNDQKERKYTILVDTNIGLISMDTKTAARELSDIRNKIAANIAGANSKCPELMGLIDQAMVDLREFIRRNPGVDESLCKLNIRADILGEKMADTVHPNPLAWGESYRTLIDMEVEEKDPLVRFKYLIKNMDITIDMLNGQVCDYGRINLVRLQAILKKLAESICVNGSDYEYEIVPGVPLIRDPKPLKEYPIELPIYMQTQHTIEPMTARENPKRSKPAISELSSINDLIAPPAETNTASDGGIADVYGLSYLSQEYNAVPSYINSFDSDELYNDRVYGKRDNKTRQNNTESRSTLNIVSERYELLDQPAVLSKVLSNRLQFGSTLLDKTLEGLAERDILGYAPPGHLISMMQDRSQNYTTTTNACLGKSPTDDTLWKQCTSHDMKLKHALDGDASDMISDLHKSMHK